MSTIPTTTNQTAPIAREEDAGEEEEIEETFEMQNSKKEVKSNDVGADKKEHDQQQQQQQQQQQHNQENVLRCGDQNTNVVVGAVVGNSKSSRVRNYLKKCKDRWLAVGLHNQMPEYSCCNGNTGHDPKSTMSTINELDVSQDLRPNTAREATIQITVNANNRSASSSSLSMGGDGGGGAGADNDDCSESLSKSSSINCALGNLKAIKENKNYVDDFDDDDIDDSYEDIDFGLRSALQKTANVNRKNKQNSAQFEMCMKKKHFMSMVQQQKQHDNNMGGNDDHQKNNNAEQLVADTVQMESHIAALIDNHLACIYPVFTNVTRAVLIREARDVLVKSYHGCLTTFEQQFLCKFKEIAVILKERHRVGETQRKKWQN